VSNLSILVVAIPALGALAIGIAASRFNPKRSRAAAESVENGRETDLFRQIALVAAAIALFAAVCLSLLDQFLKLRIAVGGNNCSAAFAVLTAAVWLPVIYVGRRSDHERPALLYGLLLLLEASYVGIFSCDHAVWLCASLLVNSVLLYLLVAGWGEPGSEGLAKKMLLMNLGADLLILVGLIGIVVASARVSATEENPSPHLTYSLSQITRELPRLATDDISAQEYWKHAQRALLTILILGAAIKAPLVPFHAWFASAVAEGPLCVGLALVGPGLRVGLYLLARFIGPLGVDLGAAADLIVGLTILGAFHESLLAYGQANAKKMIACICLLQGSLAFAGFFSMRPENASGPLMLAMASAVAGTLMIFSVNFLELRYGAGDLADLGGIAQKLPNLAGVLLIAALSLVGIPGLFGFPGLFATLGAVFSGEWTFAFLAIGATLIAGWALFSMFARLVFGPLRLPLPDDADVLIDADSASEAGPRDWSVVAEGRSGSIDLNSTELLILGPLLVSLIALGIWPQVISAALRSALILMPLSP
jgi:NADH-quinone oxidoreductase subunit M